MAFGLLRVVHTRSAVNSLQTQISDIDSDRWKGTNCGLSRSATDVKDWSVFVLQKENIPEIKGSYERLYLQAV